MGHKYSSTEARKANLVRMDLPLENRNPPPYEIAKRFSRILREEWSTLHTGSGVVAISCGCAFEEENNVWIPERPAVWLTVDPSFEPDAFQIPAHWRHPVYAWHGECRAS